VNSGRSPIGPSRQFAATQHFGRVRSKADIDSTALTKRISQFAPHQKGSLAISRPCGPLLCGRLGPFCQAIPWGGPLPRVTINDDAACANATKWPESHGGETAMVRSTRSPNGASGYRAASGAYFLSRTGAGSGPPSSRPGAARSTDRSGPAADAAVIAEAGRPERLRRSATFRRCSRNFTSEKNDYRK
jgi:hypothetical protein